MRFVFFGTPDVASDTLTFLVRKNLVPSLVVTNPDAKIGRRQEITPSPVKVLAQQHGIPVITPDQLDNETLNRIGSYDADLAIVVAYGKILPEALITSFPKGVLNIHYSLLPKYRGASPVEFTFLNNDTIAGVTIQKMVYELDAGDIVAQSTLSIGEDDTTATLRARLIQEGSELLARILPDFLSGQVSPTPQNHQLASFTRKLKKSDGEILPTDTDQEKWNKYRAYFVWPGTYFFDSLGKRIKITKAHMSTDGRFVIERVIPEGKKEIDFKS